MRPEDGLTGASGTPPPGPDFRGLEVLVGRTEALIADYVDEAREAGCRLQGTHLVSVLDQAIAHAEAPANHQPAFEESVEGCYLLGLYEELVQQPTNVYEQVTTPEGRQEWRTLEYPVWAECLRRVRASVGGSGEGGG